MEPAEIEDLIQTVDTGTLAEAETALNALQGATDDAYALEKIRSCRGLRETLESPAKVNRYPGGAEGARVQLLGDLHSLHIRLIAGGR